MDDAALLEAWRNGDGTAGSELLSRNFEALYRFFQNKVGSEAEDLIQQTMMACIESRDRFRGESSFRTFALRIARHKLYDHLRKRSSQPVDFTVKSVMQVGTGLSAAAARGEGHGRVVAALRYLPVELQVAIELHFWEDMSATEIAEVLDIPVGTVKTRLRRARQLLQERLHLDEDGAVELDATLRAAKASMQLEV